MNSASTLAATAPIGKDRPHKTSGRSARARFAALRTLSFFSLAALALWLGWAGRERSGIDPADGLGYWLGVIGGSLMLALLLYSVRKRIPWLRHLGATRHWFRMHMTLGVIGPVVILYHSNFQVGSINSQVALYCTLLVAASGIVGRYFYAQIHNGLYGGSTNLRELIASVRASGQGSSLTSVLDPAVAEQLAALAERALQRTAKAGKSMLGPVRFGVSMPLLNWRMRRRAYRYIDRLAENSGTVAEQRVRLRRATKRYIGQRLFEIRRVTQFRFFERLFSLWHIIHVPFFIMMVFSAIFHVLAVHMY